MAASIDQQIDRLTATLSQISNKDIPLAQASAANKTLGQFRTQVIRSVSRDENIPAKLVRKKTFISRASRNKLRGSLTVYARDIPVVSLLSRTAILKAGARGTNRRGVTAKGRNFPGAFVNIVLGGKSIQVLRRKGRAREPLEVLKVSIKKSVEKNVDALSRTFLRKEFPRLLAQDLKFRLGKYVR